MEETHAFPYNSNAHFPLHLTWGLFLQVKPLPAMQETQVRFLGWEDSLEKEMVTASSYSCLENPMDRGAWKAIVHGVTRVRHDLATKPPTTTVISVAPLDGQGLFKTASTEISSSVALAALFHSCYFSFFLLHCSICLRVCSLTSRVLASVYFSMKPWAASIVSSWCSPYSCCFESLGLAPFPQPLFIRSQLAELLSGVLWISC